MNSKKMRNKKITSIMLVCIILFQMIIPTILPLKSYAENNNGYVETSLGKIILRTTAQSINAGDTVPIEIYIEGTDIYGIIGYFDYDRNIFEDLTADDIEVKPTGWNLNGFGAYDDGVGNAIEMSHSQNKGTSNFTACIINLKAKASADSTTVGLNYAVVTDINNADTAGDEGIGNNISFTFPEVVTSYEIKYNANTTDSVTGMPSNGTKNEGSNYTIEAGPTRTHYTFKGWNTSADGTGTPYAAGSAYSADADLELYAQWEVDKSTLTVNPNGGVWEGSSASQTFTEGYGTTKTINDPTSTPNGNVIKFNGNGGTATKLQETQTTTFSGWTGATLNGKTYTFGTSNESIKANYTGDNISLPSATKTGSTFIGWFDAATGGNIIGGAGDTYSPAYTTPNASITLFAQYLEDTYTLTINPNGGTYNGTTSNSSVQGTYNSTTTITNPTAPNGYTVTLNNDGTTTPIVQTKTFTGWTIISGDGTISGTTYTFGTQNGEIKANYTENNVQLPEPTKAGYDFAGWYTQETGGTQVTSPYMPTSDITLYAHWTAKTYTVTFNPGNGTVSPTSKTVTYNETYGILPTPTRTGFDFDGWKEPNGNTITETDKVNITGDITLTASWLGAEYTVTFDPDGGQVNSTSKKVRNEGKYGELPTPTKIGYTFKGWINSNGDKITSTTTVDLSADETLTADWEENTYTITFNPGPNGTVNEPTRTVKYGDTYGTLPIPTKPGYVFEGWYGPDGNKIEENDVIDILTDITVTAGWTGKEYTLTFEYDGGTGNEVSRTIQNGLAYGTLPTANKTGYTFKGWFDSNGKEVQGTEIVNTTSDVTLYAKYDINKYKVTFKNDDGTFIETINVEYGKDAQYTGNIPVKSNVQAGYEATFSGWQDASKLSNITEDITVIATYTISPKIYTIAYNNLKDSDNSANPTSYTVEDSNIILADLPNQGKYIFKGWYTSNDETGIKVTSIDTSKLENIILYAQWENDSLYFRSEKYKVGENDIDNYEDGDIYLDKIVPETSLSEFINNCDTNGKITVINKNGQTLSSEDLVGTTMTIKVTRYDEEIILTAVVMGDLDENGKITATDYSILNHALLGINELNGAYFKAADLYEDDKITASDISILNKAILGVYELVYKKPNK